MKTLHYRIEQDFNSYHICYFSSIDGVDGKMHVLTNGDPIQGKTKTWRTYNGAKKYAIANLPTRTEK